MNFLREIEKKIKLGGGERKTFKMEINFHCSISH